MTCPRLKEAALGNTPSSTDPKNRPSSFDPTGGGQQCHIPLGNLRKKIPKLSLLEKEGVWPVIYL